MMQTILGEARLNAQTLVAQTLANFRLGMVMGLVSLACVTPSQADELELAKVRIAELEQQVKALTAQVAMLQKELVAIKAEATKAPASHSDASAPAATAKDSASTQSVPDGEGAPPSAPDARKPASDAVPQPITVLLREMPADLRPHPVNGWDKYTLPRVKEWLKTAFTDRPYEAKLKLDRVANSMKVGGSYEVHLVMESSKSKFGSVELTHFVRTAFWPYPVMLKKVDEKTARRVDDMKPGHIVRVRGKIDTVVLRVNAMQQHELDVVLKDYVIQPPME